jgi:hypothetical protein
MSEDFFKLMPGLIAAAAKSDITLHSKVVEFQIESNNLFELNGISIN